MKLGFYYHISIEITKDGKASMPAFLGVFIDSLAAEVEELVLFAHTAHLSNVSEYILKAANVTVVNLGPIARPYIRFYFPFYFLNRIKKRLAACDYLLVRSPSPLAPAFGKYVDSSRIVYMIVGSYKEGSKHFRLPWYKLWAVKLFNLHMHSSLSNAVKNSKIVVNSTELLDEYKHSSNTIKLINTTTLSEKDYFLRTDTCTGTEIKLLFVGRIDFAKGIRECIKVCADLNIRGIPATLSIIGWELYDDTRITEQLKSMIKDLQIERRIHFLGRKKNGDELFAYYRSHDIYLLPSYHEGFPRTIWEALANSIPVISTNVGSIPTFIKHEVEAILVPPAKTEELLHAVERLINDSGLRKRLIKNGYERVKDVRLDVQSKRIVEFIKNGQNITTC